MLYTDRYPTIDKFIKGLLGEKNLEPKWKELLLRLTSQGREVQEKYNFLRTEMEMPEKFLDAYLRELDNNKKAKRKADKANKAKTDAADSNNENENNANNENNSNNANNDNNPAEMSNEEYFRSRTYLDTIHFAVVKIVVPYATLMQEIRMLRKENELLEQANNQKPELGEFAEKLREQEIKAEDFARGNIRKEEQLEEDINKFYEFCKLQLAEGNEKGNMDPEKKLFLEQMVETSKYEPAEAEITFRKRKEFERKMVSYGVIDKKDKKPIEIARMAERIAGQDKTRIMFTKAQNLENNVEKTSVKNNQNIGEMTQNENDADQNTANTQNNNQENVNNRQLINLNALANQAAPNPAANQAAPNPAANQAAANQAAVNQAAANPAVNHAPANQAAANHAPANQAAANPAVNHAPANQAAANQAPANQAVRGRRAYQPRVAPVGKQ